MRLPGSVDWGSSQYPGGLEVQDCAARENGHRAGRGVRLPSGYDGHSLNGLQRFTGKASWTACLVPGLKPFVGSGWATLAETSRREASRGIEGRG
jgi:hypothetical protein